jgi:hypothetical protein
LNTLLSQDHKALKEIQVLKGLLVLMEPQDLLVLMEQLARQVLKGLLAHKALKVTTGW